MPTPEDLPLSEVLARREATDAAAYEQAKPVALRAAVDLLALLVEPGHGSAAVAIGAAKTRLALDLLWEAASRVTDHQ